MSSKGRNLMLVSFTCFMLLVRSSNSETDTLVQGQKLKYGAKLVSAYGIFSLGFFSRYYYDERRYYLEGISFRNQRYYLGIWYSWSVDRYETKPVWVANRNTPIYDESGILILGDDGNLKIFYSGRDPLLFTSVQVSHKTSATLLDNGNLVLRELNSDKSTERVVWQSFDHPTDTLLPGMKIGINLQTGHSWSLTSGIDENSAAPGSFTFQMDPNNTSQLVIWWAGEVYWTSGIWANGRFSLSNELSYHHYHFRYVSNENEKYFTYYVNDDTNTFPMLVMHPSGNLGQFSGIVITCKDSAGYVGGKYPICRKDLSGFSEEYGSVTGQVFKFNESENLNLNDCREKCLRNCSCVAYASSDQNPRTGCQIWSKVTIRETTHEKWMSVYVIKSKENKWLQQLIIALGGAVGISFICFLCFLMWRKYKLLVAWPRNLETLLLIWRKYKEKCVQFLQSIKEANTEKEILLSDLGVVTKHLPSRPRKNSHELQFFDFQSMLAATNNFASMNKLGEGGFGPVYKGQLADGQEVAIKRLSINSQQGLVEFKNEVKVIARLQHNNLVRLIGCCIEKEEKILIYEYMPNKSLDFFLFDPMSSNVLDWKNRFNIIEGIIKGLLYLHKFSRLKIVHRDLKASNILLDSEMNPKISDFGMAKIFEPEESRANTNRIVGTYGYMSPEYAIEGVFSIKSDVFSFGVLLLEIVSGRRNNSFHDPEGPLNLIVYAWELWQQGRGLELIDPRMCDTYQNEALRCIHIGLLCVQVNPMDRPTMSDVISMVYNEANQLPSPNQPAFYVRRTLKGTRIEEQKRENWTLNEVSITEMEAR